MNLNRILRWGCVVRSDSFRDKEGKPYLAGRPVKTLIIETRARRACSITRWA